MAQALIRDKIIRNYHKFWGVLVQGGVSVWVILGEWEKMGEVTSFGEGVKGK